MLADVWNFIEFSEEILFKLQRELFFKKNSSDHIELTQLNQSPLVEVRQQFRHVLSITLVVEEFHLVIFSLLVITQ